MHSIVEHGELPESWARNDASFEQMHDRLTESLAQQERLLVQGELVEAILIFMAKIISPKWSTMGSRRESTLESSQKGIAEWNRPTPNRAPFFRPFCDSSKLLI